MRARHTTQEEGVAVFEGLGLHPSMFCQSKENRRREGSEKACTEYATKIVSVSDGIFFNNLAVNVDCFHHFHDLDIDYDSCR